MCMDLPLSLYGEKMRTLMAPLSRRVSGLPVRALLLLAFFMPSLDFGQPPPAATPRSAGASARS